VIKNTAGQKVGAQMVSASDGSAFTGSVTVAVTVDAGTQATGSVGSGACTHEGNGFHTYAPSQAETNGDHVAFTFTGSGAVPVTVQVYTITGDAFARLGAPAGASVSADVAAVKLQTAAIETDTQDLQSRTPAALVSGRMDSSVGAMASNVMTAAAAAADLTTELQSGLATASAVSALDTKLGTPAGASVSADIAAIEAQTDDIGTAGAGLTALASAANLASLDGKVDTIDNFLDTEIAAILSDTNAIKVVTDLLTAANAEPTGVPAANATPLVKLAWLFMALRNRLDVTATKKTFYDDGGAAEWEKDVSDDGTTYSESEANAI
jgi:hypothetical protein